MSVDGQSVFRETPGVGSASCLHYYNTGGKALEFVGGFIGTEISNICAGSLLTTKFLIQIGPTGLEMQCYMIEMQCYRACIFPSHVQQQLRQGAHLAELRDSNKKRFHDMSATEQRVLEDYDCGKLQKGHDDVRVRKPKLELQKPKLE